MVQFAGHFHAHREYSPLDGSGTCNQYAAEAARKGMTHLGLTDHGRVGAALEHVDACRHPEKYDNPLDESKKRSRDERLIPIIGLEAFYRPNRFMDLSDKNVYGKNGHNWAQHLCIHAANMDGMRTLWRLSSKSWVDREHGGGHYGKACVDLDMLEQDHEGIMISTACISSPLAQFILAGDERGARRWVKRVQKLVKHKLWFEIMPHDFDDQRLYNLELYNLGQDMGIPLVATGDVHTPYKKWMKTHSCLRMISYKTTWTEQERKSDEGEDVYTEEIDTVFLSSGKQMKQMFADNHPDLPEHVVDEALANTFEFAKQCRFYVVGKTTKAPKVDIDAKEEVRKWIREGWKRILGAYPEDHWDTWRKSTYKKRFEYEFNVLDEKGVLDYFYIVGDFTRWAKSNKPLPVRRKDGTFYFPKDKSKRPIRVGLGRGSAAGSLVSYLIGITAIDPIPHKLLFERFLNPDREGYPDIDMDFETEDTVIVTDDGRELDGRECVKEYCRIVYGHDHVADIIAYSTFAPRALIKAVGDVYEINPHRLKTVTDSIGDTERGLERIANGNPKKDIEPNELVAKIRDDFPGAWKIMLDLEDQIKNDSRHAGGIVITPKPVNWYIPTQTGKDGVTAITAFADRAENPIMSDYGFLKYDILGVKALAKQEKAVQLIRDHYGVEFEPNELPALRNPLDVDQDVIDAFVKGLTVGVFQFGGRGITQLLRHIKPDNATDISVANALFRPGPIKIAFEYGDRKNGTIPITYWHDALEPILGETLGLMCFQEQAMEVVKQLAGFSGGDADKFRKIMSKLYRLPGDKAQEVMQQDHDRFIHGCMTISGMREEDAEFVWTDRMLPLGNYLFNRSHSSSYGLQAYQDMHIKLRYPLAFYAALLTVEKKSKKDEQIDFLRRAFREARIFDIGIAGPEVNRSDKGWSIDGQQIRYGLVSINDIGGGDSQVVIDHRPYKNFKQFIRKVPSNFGVQKSVALARAGAFDATDSRKKLLGRVAQWDDGVAKLKLKMTCGHVKQKTVKLPVADIEGVDPRDVGEMLEDAVEDALEKVECKHHPDAEIAERIRLDDTYEFVRWLKEHPREEPPTVMEIPSDDEILDLEKTVLNIPISHVQLALDYQPFIESFIFDEQEIEALPEKPRKKGKKHGSFCVCDDCEAAKCTVGGEITNYKVIQTKKTKENMAFFDVAFGVNQYKCTLFPVFYRDFHRMLKSGLPVLINGHKDDRGQIIVHEMEYAEDVAKAQGWRPKRAKTTKPKKKLKLKRKVAA